MDLRGTEEGERGVGDAVGREKERGEGVLRDQRKKQWVVGLPRESAVQKIDRWERKVTVNCKLSIACGRGACRIPPRLQLDCHWQ